MSFLVNFLGLIVSLSDFLFLVGAFFLLTSLAGRAARAQGLNGQKFSDFSFWLAVGALAGGRLAWMAPNWPAYLSHPIDVLRIYAGLSFFGGLAGGLLAILWYARRAGYPFWRIADFYAIYFPLAIAFNKLGCILTTECYGRLGAPPFGIIFPGLSQPRYPAELYEAILVLGLFVLLFGLSTRPGFSGRLTLLSLGGYSFIRFLSDFFRIKLEPLWLSYDQMFSLLVLALASLAYLYQISNRRSAELVSAGGK